MADEVEAAVGFYNFVICQFQSFLNAELGFLVNPWLTNCIHATCNIWWTTILFGASASSASILVSTYKSLPWILETENSLFIQQ